MFQKPLSFEGRIRRTEFGISFIIAVIAIALVNAIGSAGEGAAIIFIAYIPLYWFLWAQGAKRCHDRGNAVGIKSFHFTHFGCCLRTATMATMNMDLIQKA